MPNAFADPETHLPLSGQHYHILLALGNEAMHGYGIIQAFEAMTEGRETLLPGSLYAALGRLVEVGLLEETEPPAGVASGGPRRRYYRVTDLGRAVARAESSRLARLLELARGRNLAPGASG
ncbi:MAG TPA: PadR family transcriptional regulator [Longimicrobiales bacterium]|nr:PadR family transcriptional regulator [Longimicrobiales bacterium]